MYGSKFFRKTLPHSIRSKNKKKILYKHMLINILPKTYNKNTK